MSSSPREPGGCWVSMGGPLGCTAISPQPSKDVRNGRLPAPAVGGAPLLPMAPWEKEAHDARAPGWMPSKQVGVDAAEEAADQVVGSSQAYWPPNIWAAG